jgi:uncharacterized protein
MRFSDRGLVLSPSDLMRFQGCEHASSLDLRYANGERLLPAADSADAALLQKKGHAHEAEYLARFDPDAVHSIVHADDFSVAAAATVAAMRSGVSIIYQGALGTGPWQGWSDFLERIEGPSSLGSWSYEVVDTKLKRRADPKHALQLSLYSRAVAEIQGVSPARAHVVVGTGERISVVLADVQHYAARLAHRLEQFVAEPWPTAPDPVAACGLCRWRDHCDSYFDATDSLVRVAGITRIQRRRLEAAGVSTLAALACHEGRVPHMTPQTSQKLALQARLQFRRREGGSPAFELKPLEPSRGFANLPKPSKGDLFFDMEGDPLVEGGLEYLFGVYSEVEGNGQFQPWWAHDAAEERESAASVLAFFCERLAAFPDAHIYHYNHYEVTALKRLTQRYGVGEPMLDYLLRSKKFVDLYRVVQQGLVASESGYSLKDLETFYMEKRTGEVATAGDSIVAYENWLETREQNILDEIKHYNEIDCRSTKGLRDWLIEVRPDGAPWFVHEDAPAPPEDLIDADRQALREKFDAASDRLGPEVADLLFELNAFHGRADKPAWWEYFDRHSRDTDELIDDLESLGGLTAIAPADGFSRKYAYPKQETKLRANARVSLRGLPGNVTIVEMDRRKRHIALKGGKKTGSLPDQLDLVPSGPIKNDVLRAAVARVTASFLTDDGQFLAIDDFLARRSPRLKGVLLKDHLKGWDDLVEAAVTAVVALDSSCLPIQGPPGTGKTYVSAKVIRELVRRGKRVAVSSNAHKAIDNLLLAIAGQARGVGEQISIAKKISIGGDEPDDAMITATTSNDDSVLQTASIVGGTAWLFARPEMTDSFDYVFIDEAGQLSIANLVAIAGAAKNIVLVGDQMQLPQPVQGVHPGESGFSTLDYLMQDQRTITPDRGVFLPLSRRMHPVVCKLISDLVYDGCLSSDAGAGRHRIDGADSLPNFGVVFEDVEHAGNSQSSEEEVERIVGLHAALLGATFTDRQGRQRAMGIEDILVVSPYNAQVNLLSERLPAGARVGTVDRFQGQEAPACLISMATSSAEELPRDVAFLFSLNRLNVAISRAQALAIVVASPRLLDVPCSTLEEMTLVNALCAVQAYSGPKAP